MPNLDRIPEAIADLDAQEVPSIRKTAEKYRLQQNLDITISIFAPFY